jgi:diguanylate cyclase (GGDEF)-like protein
MTESPNSPFVTDDASPQRPQALGRRVFDGSEPCILLVDDEPVITEVMRVYLEDAGYRRVVVTNDAAASLELVRHHEPDLVLLDLMMPGMSGFQVLERLRAGDATRHVPVVVLTSASDAESRLKVLELGATDFLAKPVDPSELALRLRNILAVKAYQDRLAYCDHVTGLPNRGRFVQTLTRALAGGRGSCAVMQLNLDRFKQINDALGYGAGDRVLGELAARLGARLVSAGLSGHGESGVTVSRTGGDEFMVLLHDVTGREDLMRVSESVRTCIAEPMTYRGEKLFLTASVGIAVSPEVGGNVDSLIAHAGQAMSYAKRRGGDTWEIYRDEIDSWAKERLDLERELRMAVVNGSLRLEFQPKVAIPDGDIIGAEALVRWHNPVRGNVPPAEFIPVAEQIGLIRPLGEWVLRQACSQASAWCRRGLGELRMAVNVSPRQFQESDLCQVVQSALADSGLPARCLTLEVTESMLIADSDEVARALASIKALGVKLSVDDFGTGYSSLSYLKQFNVDELKIDRSFVADLPHNEDDAAIVNAVAAMAHSLGLMVVAEGVETVEQLDFISRIRCDQYQGYLFSAALQNADFLALFDRHVTPTAQAKRLLGA